MSKVSQVKERERERERERDRDRETETERQRERYENWYLSDLMTNNLHLSWFLYIYVYLVRAQEKTKKIPLLKRLFMQ